jgi:hypothetical protein
MELRQYLPDDDGDEETYDGQRLADLQIGPTYRLSLPVGKAGRQVSFNLTACTLAELMAVRELFTLAIDLAEPVVTHRDEVAREAQEAGDDAYSRFYRQAPEVVVRRRQIVTYSKGVYNRPEDVPPRPGGGLGGHRGGAGGAGDGVADEAPPNAGSEDDGQAVD